MKRIITICLVLAFVIAMFAMPVSAADTVEDIRWVSHGWWYQETEEFFGVNNAANACKPAYSEQVFDGTKSFKVEMSFSADVTDANVQSHGWDSLSVYLALDGKPDTNLADGFDYPGEGTPDAQVWYDQLLLRMKRWPESADSVVNVIQVKDNVATELDADALTSEQKANGHVFDLVYTYDYTSDTENKLTITLDGSVIYEADNCKDMVVGSVGFSTTHSFLKVTKATITYPEKTAPAEKITSVSAFTGDSHAAMQIGGTFAMQFATGEAFNKLSIPCPSWNSPEDPVGKGNLTWTLYKWAGSYKASIAGNAIAQYEHVDYPDNATIGLTLETPAAAGEYVLVLENTSADPNEAVGTWSIDGTSPYVHCYKDGEIYTAHTPKLVIDFVGEGTNYWGTLSDALVEVPSNPDTPAGPETGDFGVIALAFVAISSVVVKKKKEN